MEIGRRRRATQFILGLGVGLSAALFSGLPAQAETLPPAQLVFSVKPAALESDSEFSCDGTVNGLITLPAPAVGRHRLESVWVKPDGAVQESSRVSVDYPPPGGRTARVWLSFDSGGVLSSVRDDAPSTASFNGDWSLEVKWDDKPLVRGKFKVRC